MASVLTADECRVLGVLIEKAQTTPNQYPLSLNGVVVGCNQKNNRDPETSLDEARCLDALDGLRAKGLAREVSLTGSRVQKYRHVAREGLEVSTTELVLLAELLLRGPQTSGELRSRAARMHPLESVEVVEQALDGMRTRPEPLVRAVGPAPGGRAGRWAQLLAPDLHPLHTAPPAPTGHVASPAPNRIVAPASAALAALEERVARLERLVEALQGQSPS